ncbi:MAG: hypothetical protein ACYDAO_08850 [Thermoplasmataceae archaeon]
MESECGNMLRVALITAGREMRDLLAMDTGERIRKYRELEEFESKYESNCGQRMSQQVRNNDLSSFKLAQLKIAYSLREDEKKGIQNPNVASITKRFTDDEYESLRLFDKFSKIDMLKDAEIATALVNKDEQIYRIIKEWYDEQMDTFLDLLDPLSTTRIISGMISVGMRDRYNSRFDKIREGIIAYMKQDPGQLRKLFYNYEGMIKKMTEVEKKRTDIDSELRSLISSDDAESIFDDFQTLLNHVQKRELEKIAVFNTDDLKSRVRELIRKIESKRIELEREKAKLSTDPEMRINNDLRENETLRMNETIAKSVELVSKLENEVIQEINNLKDISVEMSNIKDENKIPEEQGITFEKAWMLRNQFFEDVKRSLESKAPFKLRDPIANYDLKVKNGKNFIDDRWENASLAMENGVEDPNAYSILMSYNFRKSRIFGTSSGFSIKSAVLFHDKVLKDHKIDMYQIGIQDFAPLFAMLLSSAQNEDCFIYAIIGSANGFTDQLISLITGSSKSSPLRGRKLCLILKDLRTNALFYDSSNEEAKLFGSLMATKDVNSGKMKLIKARTLEEANKMGLVRIAYLIRDTGEDSSFIMSAWKELESEKRGKISKIEGETVFEITKR